MGGSHVSGGPVGFGRWAMVPQCRPGHRPPTLPAPTPHPTPHTPHPTPHTPPTPPLACILSCNSLSRSTCRAVRGNPSISSPAPSASSGLKMTSSSASPTRASGTSSPASMRARMSGWRSSRDDMVTARARPRDSRMNGVLAPWGRGRGGRAGGRWKGVAAPGGRRGACGLIASAGCRPLHVPLPLAPILLALPDPGAPLSHTISLGHCRRCGRGRVVRSESEKRRAWAVPPPRGGRGRAAQHWPTSAPRPLPALDTRTSAYLASRRSQHSAKTAAALADVVSSPVASRACCAAAWKAWRGRGGKGGRGHAARAGSSAGDQWCGHPGSPTGGHV